MRFACGDVGDHIISYKNDHRSSYRPQDLISEVDGPTELEL